MILRRTSASQVKDFRACPRLWYYKTVLRQSPPPSPAMAKGTAIHAALESYLKNTPVDQKTIDLAATVGLTPQDLQEFIEAIRPLVGTPGEGITEYRDEMPTYDDGPTWALVVDHAREVEVPNYGTIPQIGRAHV